MAGINFKGILKGVVFFVIVTLLTMLLITLVTYFSDINQKAIDIIVFIGLGIGVFMGAFPVSKSADEKSALHGILVGVGAILIFLVCSFFANGKISFNAHFISVLCVCILSGFLGGVLGR